jgi:integrase
MIGRTILIGGVIATKRCPRDPFQHPDPLMFRRSSTASCGAPSATRRARSRRRPAARMRRGDTVGAERLTGQSVALIVKRRSKAAGLGPEQLSGHSLRAGYVTAAAAAGVEERKIANVSRHKDLPVLRRYIGAATAFDDVGEVL